MVVISVAPNGARKTTKDIPTLPVTPSTIAKEAARCLDAGASLFHLHVRDQNQRHSLDPQLFRDAIAAIHAEIGPTAMVLQITTESVGIYAPEDIISTVREVSPEAFSVGIRELIPTPEFETEAQLFLKWAYLDGLQIQYILYSDEDIFYFHTLIERGVIPRQDHYFLLYVLGKKTGTAAKVEDLSPMLFAQHSVLASLSLDFGVCAFGPQELDCLLASVNAGGHVRIGFENNHLLSNGSPATTTSELVDQFCHHLPQWTEICHAGKIRLRLDS